MWLPDRCQHLPTFHASSLSVCYVLTPEAIKVPSLPVLVIEAVRRSIASSSKRLRHSDLSRSPFWESHQRRITDLLIGWFIYSLNDFRSTNAKYGVQKQVYKDNHTSSLKELKVEWREEKSKLGVGSAVSSPAPSVWLVAMGRDGWEQLFPSALASRGSLLHLQGLGPTPHLLNLFCIFNKVLQVRRICRHIYVCRELF